MRYVCDKCKTEFESERWRKNCSSSCGKKHAIKKYECSNPEKVLLNRAKQRAKKHNLDFNLVENDIVIPTFCPILGLKLEIKKRTNKGVYKNAPSLDRIDSTKGYTKDNIRVISNRANSLKSNASIDELEKILKDAYEIHSRY